MVLVSSIKKRFFVNFEELSNFDCEIQTLPSLTELISGKSLLPNWESMPIDQILSRKDVDLVMNDANDHYAFVN